MALTKLIDNVSGVSIDSDPLNGKGGSAVIHITASTFGSGQVHIEGRLRNLQWTTLRYGGNLAIYSENIIFELTKFTQSMDLRARLVGADGATNNVSVYIDS